MSKWWKTTFLFQEIPWLLPLYVGGGHPEWISGEWSCKQEKWHPKPQIHYLRQNCHNSTTQPSITISSDVLCSICVHCQNAKHAKLNSSTTNGMLTLNWHANSAAKIQATSTGPILCFLGWATIEAFLTMQTDATKMMISYWEMLCFLDHLLLSLLCCLSYF